MKDSDRTAKDSKIFTDSGFSGDRFTVTPKAAPKGKLSKKQTDRQKAIESQLQKLKSPYVYTSGNLRNRIGPTGPNKMLEA